MGTGDRSDPTTDAFDSHRAQCLAAANDLRDQPTASALVAKLDQHVALCDAAIARGRRREDMATVEFAETARLFAALAHGVKATFHARQRARVGHRPANAAPAIERTP